MPSVAPPPAPPAGAPPLPRPRRRGRALLLAALATVLTIVVLTVAFAAFVVTRVLGSPGSNVGRVTFAQPLRIPPLATPEDDGAGGRAFALALTPGTAELKPGLRTPSWGYDGAYLGPTLRATRGERVTVRFRNSSTEETTVHWHGMHLPAAVDGGPHQPVAPGGTWTPSWTVDQPAATLWYHPHGHERTAEQVYRGAAGLFLLDDPEADRLGLPARYGVDDVPLVVQDKRFRDDGSLDTAAGDTGLLGDEILVNGTWGPVFEATTTLVRFRVLNASNARVYQLRFADDRRFDVIAGDSGLLPAPVPARGLDLAPGERAEIVVPVRPGDDVLLRSEPLDLGTTAIEGRLSGADDTMELLRLRGAATLAPSPPVPAVLVPASPAVAPAGAVTRSFRFSGTTINGRGYDPRRVDAAPEAGTDEVWEVHATSGLHVFHLHDVRFRLLDVDGAPPPAVLAGWKDTVRLPPGRRLRLLVRFDGPADPDHPYMVHCHVLAHEDNGMMGQVVVVPPGSPPPEHLPGGHGAGGHGHG